jgi:hypothetical protein
MPCQPGSVESTATTGFPNWATTVKAKTDSNKLNDDFETGIDLTGSFPAIGILPAKLISQSVCAYWTLMLIV